MFSTRGEKDLRREGKKIRKAIAAEDKRQGVLKRPLKDPKKN